MKFCNQCGAELTDEVIFCYQCGAKADNAENIINTEYPQQSIYKEKRKNRLIPVLAAILIIATVITGVICFSGRSKEKVVKDFVDGITTGNVKKVMSLMPDEMFDRIADEEFDGDRDAMLRDGEESMNEMLKSLKDKGATLKDTTYEILSEKDMDDKMKGKVIKAYDGVYADMTEGKILEVRINIPISGKKDGYPMDMDLYVVKLGRSWYMVMD